MVDPVDQAAADLNAMSTEEVPGAELRRTQASQMAMMFIRRYQIDIMTHPDLAEHIQNYVKYNRGFQVSIPTGEGKTLQVALGAMPV